MSGTTIFGLLGFNAPAVRNPVMLGDISLKGGKNEDENHSRRL